MFSSSSLSLLRLRNFRLMLAVRFLTTMALQAQAVIIGWQIYALTKNLFLLGLTGLVEALPAIVCALFAGHLVDIHHPQRIYFLSLTALALNTLSLLFVAGGIVHFPVAHLVPFIFGGTFVSGLARSFLMPSSFSLLPRIVSKPQLVQASAWLSSTFQVAAITGPAAAGLVYGGYGSQGAWILPALLLAFSCLTTAFMRVRHEPRPVENRLSPLSSIQEGLSFIIKRPVLLSVMLLDMFAVLFGGATAMLPAYADRILHVGSQGLGVLRAAPALGAMIVALVFALRPIRRLSGLNLLYVVSGFGLCIVGFGLSHVFWFSLLMLAFSGGFDSISVVIRSTLVQLLTPDTMKGRVSSVSSMFIISSNEIGSFESGVAAKLLGLVPSVVFGGVMTLVVVLATAVFSPQLRAARVDVNERDKT